MVPEQTPKETLEDRIVSALRQSAAPIPRTELRQALAVNNNRLGPVLEDLERKGLVQRTALGWAIP